MAYTGICLMFHYIQKCYIKSQDKKCAHSSNVRRGCKNFIAQMCVAVCYFSSYPKWGKRKQYTQKEKRKEDILVSCILPDCICIWGVGGEGAVSEQMPCNMAPCVRKITTCLQLFGTLIEQKNTGMSVSENSWLVDLFLIGLRTIYYYLLLG